MIHMPVEILIRQWKYWNFYDLHSYCLKILIYPDHLKTRKYHEWLQFLFYKPDKESLLRSQAMYVWYWNKNKLVIWFKTVIPKSHGHILFLKITKISPSDKFKTPSEKTISSIAIDVNDLFWATANITKTYIFKKYDK